MQKPSNRMRYFSFPIIILGFFYILACSDQTNWSPTDSSPQLTLNKSGKGSGGSTAPSSDLLLVRKREEAENGVSRAVIGPEGGVLIHAAHRIEIAAGALSEPVELTFSMPVSDTLMFELGPDGIQFQGPVKVIFNYDHAQKNGLDETLFNAVFWNADTQSWESVPSTVDTELNEVVGSTTHFSRYAISKG